jgi:uncharacterized membrane protein YphA (DoxX/SURF4 family)
MHKFTSFLQSSAPIVLRLGMSIVILWFSVQQFLHTKVWTAYVPDSAVAITHLSAVTLVYINAFFELVLGGMLIFGWHTRIVALLLALHLFDIMWVVGYGEIGVRDFGLAVATLVVSMNGPDIFCFHYKQATIQSQQMPLERPVEHTRKLI